MSMKPYTFIGMVAIGLVSVRLLVAAAKPSAGEPLPTTIETLVDSIDDLNRDPASLAAAIDALTEQARKSESGTPKSIAAQRAIVILSALRDRAADSVSNDAKPAVKPTPGEPGALAIFRAHCYECHNPARKKGRLTMDTRAAMLEGGKDGPAIVPGDAGESLVLELVQSGAKPHMPPKKQLTDAQIAELKRWIEAGAPWDAQALAGEASDVAASIELAPLPPRFQPALAIAISPDGARLAVGRGSRIVLYDLADDARPQLGVLTGHQDVVQSLAFSPDGAWLASGGYRRVLVWDPTKPQPHAELTDFTGRVTALAFMPDGKTLIAAEGRPGQSNALRTFSIPDGEPTTHWPAHADTIFAVQVSRDGTTIVTAGADKVVKVWEFGKTEPRATFEGHTDYVTALALNVDGTRLASGSADRAIKVWNVQTGEQTITIKGHPRAITGLAWAADGKRIFSVCEDGTLRVNRQARRRASTTLHGTDDVLYNVVISADGKTLCAGGHDGSVYVWTDKGKLEARLGPTETAKSAEKVAAK